MKKPARLNNILGYWNKGGYAIATAGGEGIAKLNYHGSKPFHPMNACRKHAKAEAKERGVKVAGIIHVKNLPTFP